MSNEPDESLERENYEIINSAFFEPSVNQFQMPREHTERLNEIARLAAIGAAWEKDSSLEKWFPITAEAIQTIISYARRCDEITDSEMSPKLVYEELESVMGNCKQGLEFARLKTDYTELHSLVELYLCTSNTNPIVADHYDRLVQWFQSHKRPDGTEPLPVATP